MDIEEQIQYWIASSDDDYLAMIDLFEKGHNTWCLFIGHLVLEKLLKSWYVKSRLNTPPFTHDLVRIAEKANLILDDEQKDRLDTISAFNIRGRYDDYNREFYKKCTDHFTKEWVYHIKEFRQWIKKRLPG